MLPVELSFIVSGLSEFVGAINTANGALDKLAAPGKAINSLFDKLVPHTNLLEQGFNYVSDAISSFGERLWQIATVTIGVILRDAFEWLLRTLKDIVASSFEAAAAFQLIEMRLSGLNLQAAIDSGLGYAEAMAAATQATKEQMDWVMKLAAITPYDAEDIAKTFTMATAFGFNTTAAKELTENILDFTAAMGLGSQEQERVIINLGQMVQRGKITTREMNDLARGSLLPLGDVLDRISEKLGITTEALTALISKPGGGVDPQLFIDAFNEMVTSEERFKNAAVRMAHTFQGAMENVWQSIRDVAGYFILLPGFLDPVGKRLGDIMDEVGERWDEITDAAGRVGTALGDITNAILDLFFPSAEKTVDGVIGALDSLSQWLTENKDPIIKFFEDIANFLFGEEKFVPFKGVQREGGAIENFGKGVQGIYDWFVLNWPKIEGFFSNIGRIIEENIVPWIEEHLVPAFDEIKVWVDENKPAIDAFFKSLGDIGENVISGLTGEKRSKGEESVLATILDEILVFMKWVTDHETEISTFVENWARFWLITQGLKIASGPILDTIMGFWANIGLVATARAILKLEEAETTIENIWQDVEDMKNIDLAATFQSWIDTLKTSEWFQAGVSIAQNIIDGIGSLFGILVDEVDWEQLGSDILSMMGLGIISANLNSEGSNPLSTVFQDWLDKLMEIEWFATGAAIMQQIINGIGSLIGALIRKVVGMMIAAWNAAMAALGLPGISYGDKDKTIDGVVDSSSSGGGTSTSKRSTGGKLKTGTGVIQRSKTPTGAVVSPTTVASTSNYNLTINTKAPKENILQDYAVLKSLKG